MKKSLIWTGLLCFASAALALAADPTWWTESGKEVIDSSASHDVSGNYAPANLGQLKHMAKQAKGHLDAELPGGAGSAIDTMVASFGVQSSTVDNYAPINLGQLKSVAKPFYDRLDDKGYDTKASLIARGYSDKWTGVGAWTGYYPWNPSTPVEENYAPANIGQLKMAFSFDLETEFNLSLDNDGNGITDQWEEDNFPGDVTLNGDPDGDGLSNLTEYLQGNDPNSADGESGVEFVETGLRVFTSLE